MRCCPPEYETGTCRRCGAPVTRLHGKDRRSSAAPRTRGRNRQPPGCAGGTLPRLCAVHDHGTRAARRARRAEAGAPAHPLRHEHPAAGPRLAVQEERQDRRRRDGLVPSAWRPGDLRRAGAPRAGFLVALSARGRAGELRQHRRRFGRRLPLHRSAHDRRRAPAAGGHRRGFDRLPRELFRRPEGAHRPSRRLPEPAGQRRAPASRSAWRRRSRRTTSPNSATPRST